ncbi:MAG: LysM peptidoglycan-binding domain-containing protein, partial [Humibacillus sp.]
LRAITESALGPGGWHGLTGPGRRPDEVLVVLLATAATALAAWLALGCALGLLSAVPGAVGWWSARVAARLTPRLVRKLLTVALTTSTASLVLPTATVVPSAASSSTVHAAVTADDGADAGTPEPATRGPGFRVTSAAAAEPNPSTPASTVARAPTPSPGFRPSAPVRAHDPSSSDLLTRSPRPATALLEAVTVRRGDTLWAIAARHLGADAGDAEIAREWPRWYAANRAVIGVDPDLIRPGTQLAPPREGDLR